MKSRWDEYKEKNGSTVFDLLNPKTQYADDETASTRYDTCKGCEHFTQHTKQCKKCGCFMVVKTKIQQSKCPLGKW